MQQIDGTFVGKIAAVVPFNRELGNETGGLKEPGNETQPLKHYNFMFTSCMPKAIQNITYC